MSGADEWSAEARNCGKPDPKRCGGERPEIKRGPAFLSGPLAFVAVSAVSAVLAQSKVNVSNSAMMFFDSLRNSK